MNIVRLSVQVGIVLTNTLSLVSNCNSGRRGVISNLPVDTV